MTNRLFSHVSANSILSGFQGQPQNHYTPVWTILSACQIHSHTLCTLRFGKARREQLDLLPNCISGGAEVQRRGAVLCAKLLQSRPTLCDSMDCSPPCSSVHGILQARILEWVAMPSSRGSTWPRSEPESLTTPALEGGFFTTSTTWEAPREGGTP